MIERAQRLADDVLFPAAQDVDRGAIPATHFEAMADAGLFSIVDLPPSDARRTIAAIGGGCGATFFVWVQHHGVLRAVTSSTNTDLRDRLEAPLRAGTIIGGTAFAHVRRDGPAAVTATRTSDGWRLDGLAPWATSWGIARRFCVAAETDDGRIVWSMISGDRPAGVTETSLGLPVFAATGTVALAFDGCVVDDADVVAIDDAHDWRRADRRRASVGQPAILGVGERAIRLIRTASRGGSDEALRTARRLSDELSRLWANDDALIAGLGDGDDLVEAASDHRAECLTFGQQATMALLAAVGGMGMDLGHPAQRLAREAAFYVIQAQTVDGRTATLRSIVSPGVRHQA